MCEDDEGRTVRSIVDELRLVWIQHELHECRDGVCLHKPLSSKPPKLKPNGQTTAGPCFLVGQFHAVGSQPRFKNSKGSIIIIDEAEELVNDHHSCGRDRGRDVVEEIMARLNDLTDTTVVLLGYFKDMADLYRVNEGLERRIFKHIHLEDYKPADLAEIFKRMAKHRGYSVQSQAHAELMKGFVNAKRYIPRYNGGLAEHLLLAVETEVSRRFAANPTSDRKEIQQGDVKKGSQRLARELANKDRATHGSAKVASPEVLAKVPKVPKVLEEVLEEVAA